MRWKYKGQDITSQEGYNRALREEFIHCLVRESKGKLIMSTVYRDLEDGRRVKSTRGSQCVDVIDDGAKKLGFGDWKGNAKNYYKGSQQISFCDQIQ